MFSLNVGWVKHLLTTVPYRRLRHVHKSKNGSCTWLTPKCFSYLSVKPVTFCYAFFTFSPHSKTTIEGHSQTHSELSSAFKNNVQPCVYNVILLSNTPRCNGLKFGNWFVTSWQIIAKNETVNWLSLSNLARWIEHFKIFWTYLTYPFG